MRFLVPLVLFGLFWTAIVGMADVMIGSSMVSSLRALSYERTQGTITQSDVVRHEDSDGDTYGVDVRYAYVVDGVRHEGRRYSYSVVTSSDRAWAARIVEAYPVGSTRDVYYDRSASSESVLQTGIDGSTQMFLLFLTPFNLVMVGIWVFVANGFLRLRQQGVQAPLPTFQRGGATHVRLTRLSWPVAGVIGFGGASFAAIFLIGLGTGFHPEAGMMVAAWTLIALVGLYAAFDRRRKELAGWFDFSIDQRFVSFPVVAGEPARLQLRKADVADIEMKLTGHDDDTPQFDILVRERGGAAHKVAAWSGEETSQEIVAWLRLQLRGGR